MEESGRKRGCLLPGGEVELHQAAAFVLKDFRSGILVAVTLDQCPSEVQGCNYLINTLGCSVFAV